MFMGMCVCVHKLLDAACETLCIQSAFALSKIKGIQTLYDLMAPDITVRTRTHTNAHQRTLLPPISYVACPPLSGAFAVIRLLWALLACVRATPPLSLSLSLYVCWACMCVTM